MRAWEEMGNDVVSVTGTEYLELISSIGCTAEDFPTCQAVGQHQIWEQVN